MGAAFFEHGAHICFAVEVAYRGADLVASRQKLEDAVAADESGSAGHEDCAHMEDSTPLDRTFILV